MIVQFRTDASKPHEQECFREELLEYSEQIEFISAIDEELPTDLSEYAGVILGGSGEFMLGTGDGESSWKQKTFDFIDRILEKNIPLLGICFGYQLLALQQGASITDNEQMRETGTYRVTLLDQGKNDVLFRGLPETFLAQFGHKETIIHPPDHFIPLASTDRVYLNSYTLQNKRAWGVLSHPELNPDRMRTRVQLFPQYTNGKDLDEVLKNFVDSKEAKNILLNFVTLLKE